MKKRILPVLISLLLIGTVIGASGCGPGKGPASGYDLSYASWDLDTPEQNNIRRRMVKEFENIHGVKIKVENITASGNLYLDTLVGLAASGNLPDVFMLQTIPESLSNDWLLDIAAYVSADADWENIPAALDEAVRYGSGVYAVPSGMFFQGVFINLDLFNEKGATPLTFGFDTPGFISAAKNSRLKTGSGKSTTLPLGSEESLIDWYAASIKGDYGYYTYDGSGFHLDSYEFAQGINHMKDIRSGKYSFMSYEKAKTQSTLVDGGMYDMWGEGRIGMLVGRTYEQESIAGMFAPKDKSPYRFNMDFLGLPGGRSVLVSDYIGVNSNTGKPDLAYELAKWMGFSPESIEWRLDNLLPGDVSEENNRYNFNSMPLTKDPGILDRYFEKNDLFPGIRRIYDNIDQFFVEPTKILPGFKNARWNASTGVKPQGSSLDLNMEGFFEACWAGTQTYADKADGINNIANKAIADAKAKLARYYA